MERGGYSNISRGRGRGGYGGGRNNTGPYGGGRNNTGPYSGGRNNTGPYGGGGINNTGGWKNGGGRGNNEGGGGRFHPQHQPGSSRGRGYTPQSQHWIPQNLSQNPCPVELSKPNHPNPHTPPNAGSIRISEQKAEKMIPPVRRPDNGGTLAIRTCELRANHFPVKFNWRTLIFHYHVEVKPNVAPRNNRPQKISKSDLSMIRDKLFSDHLLSTRSTAYDGEKNIFSAVPLPEETFVVDVSKGEDERTVSYSVTLTLVNKLELRKLRDYLAGPVLSIPRDVLQGLDLVVKENPSKSTVSLGRCFFPMNPPLKEAQLQPAVIAIRGFQQSLRLTSQGLVIDLDTSLMSFRKKMSVLDFLHARIRGFDLRDFRRFRPQVEAELAGLKVTVTHRRTKQKYTIARLTQMNTRHIKFTVVDPEGVNRPRETSLVAYFQEKYGVEIKFQDIPALEFRGNKANYVPMELCVLVEGQRFPKENLEKEPAKDLKKMSLAPPREREAAILEMMRSSNGPGSGGIMQNFGLDVCTSMTDVTGRVIEPPKLKIADKNGKVCSISLDPNKCQWNLVGRSMVEGKPVECWAILDFTSRVRDWRRFKDYDFVPMFIDKYRKMGIYMNKPNWYEASDMQILWDSNELCKILEKIDDLVQKQCRRRLQFLLCVMTDKHQGYKCLKWIAETKVGIVTQCCLSGNANKPNDQYLTNLALKINAKIGGSNVELNGRLPHFEGEGHVMFIGADVNHPGARDTNSPSIAAVVATVNWPAANRYAARVCAQDHRTEKILNFGDVCLDLVSYYERLNKVRPEKIVVFRDGVSESQFQMVLTEELQDLKSAFRCSNYFPTITLVVAQKRHQTRFFPANAREGIPNGNVFPGTVVDTKVVHPFEFDFYLCSHYGSLGTSKPTHYHVLWDEHKFSSDDLQKLIYDMCFTFARCTKPVSLVPPVYYADLTAYRGRLYYEAMIRAQSPNSASSPSSPIVSSSISSTSSSLNDPACYKLHTDVENIMFFV